MRGAITKFTVVESVITEADGNTRTFDLVLKLVYNEIAPKWRVCMWKKGFWVIFASFSAFHLIEDLLWAVVARFTNVPIVMIIGGILLWALFSTVVLHTRPFRKYWNHGNK